MGEAQLEALVKVLVGSMVKILILEHQVSEMRKCLDPASQERVAKAQMDNFEGQIESLLQPLQETFSEICPVSDWDEIRNQFRV
ncbi:hypothetical protein [Mesoterricola sediminis]|uniref:hypothetical protein n=1 Tax=Mesoterricola sediminis TaxID=2927980 RepID=UPI00292FD490|nr:hypothetical protein [Mesoterricola sediminis]